MAYSPHVRCGSFAMVLAMYVATAPLANAQTVSPETRPTYENLYTSAIRCFVANGHAKRQRDRVGDVAGATRYDANARQAHALAFRTGQALGYSTARTSGDFDLSINQDLPRMAGDNAYFTRIVAGCRAMQLM